MPIPFFTMIFFNRLRHKYISLAEDKQNESISIPVLCKCYGSLHEAPVVLAKPHRTRAIRISPRPCSLCTIYHLLKLYASDIGLIMSTSMILLTSVVTEFHCLPRGLLSSVEVRKEIHTSRLFSCAIATVALYSLTAQSTVVLSVVMCCGS